MAEALIHFASGTAVRKEPGCTPFKNVSGQSNGNGEVAVASRRDQ